MRTRRNTKKSDKRLKQREAQRRYRANVNAGIEYFGFRAGHDLLQNILRQIAPERLPPKVGDYSHAELQHALNDYMQDEWLGAWRDVFEYGARHAQQRAIMSPVMWRASCAFRATSTLTADAIVIDNAVDLQTGVGCRIWETPYPVYELSLPA